MKKRVLLVIAALILMMCACGNKETDAEGQDVTEENQAVEKETEETIELEFKYLEEDDGTLCVYAVSSESGKLPDYIEIPEEIEGKKVGSLENTFHSDDRGGKEVVVPGSLKEIRSSTFELNATIEKITIQGTELIESDAISMCDKLEELVIEEGTKTIEDNFAYACANLKKVYLPASVESMGEYGCLEGAASDLTVYAPAGSYVEKWALEKGYNFQAQ